MNRKIKVFKSNQPEPGVLFTRFQDLNSKLKTRKRHEIA
jgi:hypothetical protein